MTVEVEFFGKGFGAESNQTKGQRGVPKVDIPYGAFECWLLVMTRDVNVKVLLPLEIRVTKGCISLNDKKRTSHMYHLSHL